MKKIPGCVIAAIVLTGCYTMETYIADLSAYHEPIEIDIPGSTLFTFDKSGMHIHWEIFDKNFKKKTLVMDEYYLIEDSQIADFSGVPPKGSSGLYYSSIGGKYSFFKENLCLGQFEIVTESTIIVFSNSSSIGSSQKYIRITDKNDIKREIKPNALNADIYLYVYDEEIGGVEIVKYESRSANQPADSPWKYHTGFIIKINGEEYGILAFYQKPQFYQRIEFSGGMDEKTPDKILLYMFMAFESFNRNDDVFAN
jgi:hypothetical protein